MLATAISIPTPALEKFCTASVAPRERVGAWNDWINNSVTALNIDAAHDADFEAVLYRARLGYTRFLFLASDAAQIYRSREHIIKRREEPVFLVHLQRSGKSFNYQDGRETVLEQGDYVLRDSTREYKIALVGSTENLVVRIPYNRLKERLSCPESLTCIRMPGNEGMSGLVSNFIQQLWERLEGTPEAAREHLADILLDLLVESYRELHDTHIIGSSSAFARRLQVTQFIEANLRNVELSARIIADSLHMSSRYLHRLFQNQGSSIGQLVLHHRLDACSKNLTDPLLTDRSITEIAFRWGFNSSTYFGRTFKKKFGVTPKDYRRLHTRDGNFFR